MTNNQINYWRYKEDSRHNKVSEVETERHNRVTEVETQRHNVVSEGEVLRHNVVTENETQRHNVRMENETERHNVESEILGEAQIRLGYANVNLGYAQLREQARSNLANEQIRSRANEITNSYNQGLLGLRRSELDVARQQQSETVRHNQAMESETVSHNVAMEKIGILNADASQEQARAAIINAGANQQNADTNQRNSYTTILNTIWSNTNRGIEVLGKLTS